MGIILSLMCPISLIQKTKEEEKEHLLDILESVAGILKTNPALVAGQVVIASNHKDSHFSDLLDRLSEMRPNLALLRKNDRVFVLTGEPRLRAGDKFSLKGLVELLRKLISWLISSFRFSDLPEAAVRISAIRRLRPREG